MISTTVRCGLTNPISVYTARMLLLHRKQKRAIAQSICLIFFVKKCRNIYQCFTAVAKTIVYSRFQKAIFITRWTEERSKPGLSVSEYTTSDIHMLHYHRGISGAVIRLPQITLFLLLPVLPFHAHIFVAYKYGSMHASGAYVLLLLIVRELVPALEHPACRYI